MNDIRRGVRRELPNLESDPVNLDTLLGQQGITPSSTTTSVQVNVQQHHHYYYGGDSSGPYSPRKGGQSKMKTFVVMSSGEDGKFIAECPSIPGCLSQGDTKEEAIENIKEAIQLCMETRKEMGLPEFEETIEVEV
jgi:predicted RNase H-like HicB family nuclease